MQAILPFQQSTIYITNFPVLETQQNIVERKKMPVERENSLSSLYLCVSVCVRDRIQNNKFSLEFSIFPQILCVA